jgi:hypothetical protein
VMAINNGQVRRWRWMSMVGAAVAAVDDDGNGG